MQPKLDHIRQLANDRKWNNSELARQMGVSRSEVHRLLNGKRAGGKKVISGLMQAFPDESLDSLFFLPCMYPIVNTNPDNGTIQNCAMKPVKHPDAHQLACEMCEMRGLIEIKQGKNVTVLSVPPGRIEVEYTTAQ